MTRLTMNFYHLFSQGGINHISMYMQPIIWNCKMFENPMKSMYQMLIGKLEHTQRAREKKLSSICQDNLNDLFPSRTTNQTLTGESVAETLKIKSKKNECFSISFCFPLFKCRDNMSSKPFCFVSSDQVVQVSDQWLSWEKRACDIVLLAVTAAECSVAPRHQPDFNQSYKTHLTLSHTHTSIKRTLSLAHSHS